MAKSKSVRISEKRKMLKEKFGKIISDASNTPISIKVGSGIVFTGSPEVSEEYFERIEESANVSHGL